LAEAARRNSAFRAARSLARPSRASSVSLAALRAAALEVAASLDGTGAPAALGAEGLAADVTMLIGNGYVPGHADYALDLFRGEPAVRALFAARRSAH